MEAKVSFVEAMFIYQPGVSLVRGHLARTGSCGRRQHAPEQRQRGLTLKRPTPSAAATFISLLILPLLS